MNTKKWFITVIIAVIGGVIAITGYLFIYDKFSRRVVVVEQAQPVRYASLTDASGSMTDFTVAAEKTVSAVVHVKTKYTETGVYRNPFYDFFYGGGGYQQYEVPVLGAGSGVIISPDGYIVTNNHVVSKSEYIEVVLNDKRTYPAKIIGKDATTDIALLKIDEESLPSIFYGNSDDLKVGEWVLAVGNPFNLTSTVTAGIVSAKARNINILTDRYAIESFIQTDAVVNPGNSGGALVNTRGELVGINTAIASNTGSFSGYSFAIPVNIVKKIVADLIEFGDIQRAYMGVSIADINSEVAKELNLDKIEGIYVSGVNPGQGAANAGIEPGDIITGVDGKNVNSVSELQEQMSKYRPGDKINITLKHKGSIKTVSVSLHNMEGATKIARSEIVSALGAKFREATPEEKNALRINHGLRIVEIGPGKLMSKGIKEGFIITYINKTPVSNIDSFKKILENTKGGIFIEGIYPNGMTAYYAFGI